MPSRSGPLVVSIDTSVEAGDWADPALLDALASRAIDAIVADLSLTGETELSILLTDDAHIRALNAQWREKNKATNVLSFPAFPIVKGGVIPPMLGDIALAYETIASEAELDGKTFDHHLTHLVVHGALHLLGYDHENDGDAEEMEAAERRILARLAITDPYAVSERD